jgi:hypothetical protein
MTDAELIEEASRIMHTSFPRGEMDGGLCCIVPEHAVESLYRLIDEIEDRWVIRSAMRKADKLRSP